MSDNVANSVGEMLRSAREAEGAHTRVCEPGYKDLRRQSCRLWNRTIFDSVGSDIYLKGFLRNYARLLGVDVEEVMRALDRQRGRGTHGVGTMWDIEEAVDRRKSKVSPAV